ncbi:hypothetical protein J1N51_00465 [Psychrosphaera ytuae]|uniref:Lipoprotein n=1 Tax=Psychrosphaera ytuae TaxID=2820710 RepID=A0A975DBC2_9GAMM|nr:DUF6174 domain-containing protein [Psychrosphaera ytuae]QTH64007.1 hypothetical protein J1N51_00465 [Psychrosphaera ytuae]
MRIQRRSFTLMMFAAFSLTGCGDASDNVDYEQIEQLIKSNQSEWRAAGLIDYSFTYSVTPGDCPTADALPSVDVYVEDGEVSRVYYTGTDQQTENRLGLTIDEVFQLQLRELASLPIQFSETKSNTQLPTFDISLGYPLRAYIDQSYNDCDAMAIRVSNFN